MNFLLAASADDCTAKQAGTRTDSLHKPWLYEHLTQLPQLRLHYPPLPRNTTLLSVSHCTYCIEFYLLYLGQHSLHWHALFFFLYSDQQHKHILSCLNCVCICYMYEMHWQPNTNSPCVWTYLVNKPDSILSECPGADWRDYITQLV